MAERFLDLPTGVGPLKMGLTFCWHEPGGVASSAGLISFYHTDPSQSSLHCNSFPHSQQPFAGPTWPICRVPAQLGRLNPLWTAQRAIIHSILLSTSFLFIYTLIHLATVSGAAGKEITPTIH